MAGSVVSYCDRRSKQCVFFMAPAVQYGKYGAILNLENLGRRWCWERTKVWRSVKKHGDVFALYRLSSLYGCQRVNITTLEVQDRKQIRVPCGAVDLTEIAKELEKPFEGLDMLLEQVDLEVSWGNPKLESRLEAITILSIRLWAAPDSDVDVWLEMVALIEGLE